MRKSVSPVTAIVVLVLVVLVVVFLFVRAAGQRQMAVIPGVGPVGPDGRPLHEGRGPMGPQGERAADREGPAEQRQGPGRGPG